MTHIEIFERIDNKKTAFLFDYQNRNPINKEAKIMKINDKDIFENTTLP